jgi:hypothetical protein
MKKKHKCQESISCCCSITALEPDDDCPIHGHPFTPRCEICGQFMKWPKTNGSGKLTTNPRRENVC